MEAAALYAFAQVKGKAVICFAHITNQMGQIEGDFEKGVDQGSHDALNVIRQAARRWLDQNPHSSHTLSRLGDFRAIRYLASAIKDTLPLGRSAISGSICTGGCLPIILRR